MMQESNTPPPRLARLPYLARRTASRLLDRIRRRHRPGDRLGTEIELAAQFSVSVSTMRRAMGWLVEQGWIHRSRRSGTFVAEGQPGRRGRTIGLLTHMPLEVFSATSFYKDFFVGLAAAAMEAGARLELLPVRMQGDRRLLAEALERADLAAMDAVVTFSIIDVDPLQTLAANVPVVVTEFLEDCRRMSAACFDYDPGVHAALEHLAALGHRRIAFVGHSHLRDGGLVRSPRYDLFVRTAERMGFDLRMDWCMDARRFDDAIVAVQRLLARPPADRPTAIATCNILWPILHQMVGGGIVPGRDVSVVSLSPASLWPEWLEANRLLQHCMPWGFPEAVDMDELAGVGTTLCGLVPTTVVLDANALGRAAVADIQRRWADPRQPPRKHTIPAGLQTGNTTGPPAAA